VLINAGLLTILFHRELEQAAATDSVMRRPTRTSRVPGVFVAFNLVLLGGVVFANHDPEVFMGLFLLFLGLAEAYKRHHRPTDDPRGADGGVLPGRSCGAGRQAAVGGCRNCWKA